MSAPRRLAAVVPVFDHAATVRSVVIGCAEHVPLVIVVDDGSSDGSADEVEQAIADARGLAEIVLLRHPRNMGKGAALLTAFRAARDRDASAALVLDADGQHRASDVPAFAREHASCPSAILLGHRDLSGPRVPASSRFGRVFSNFWVRRTTGLDVPDSQCGYRLLPLAPVLALDVRARRYDYEVEVLVRAAWAGMPVRSVPIDVWYPEPDDRISHFRALRDNARISWTYTRLIVRRLWPIPTSWTSRARDPGRPAPRRTMGIRLRRFLTQGTSRVDLGVAAGVGALIGASPLWGLHGVLSVYVAARTHLNPITAWLGSNVSAPVLAPFLLYAQLRVGSLVLGERLPAVDVAGLTPEAAWKVPLLYVVGSIPVAVVVGAITGLATYVAARLCGGGAAR